MSVRLLRKYLYKQIKDTLENESSDASSIFEKSDQSSPKCLFKIKQGVNFHLFISSAPCGDGRIFSMHDNIADSTDSHPNRRVRGLLRAKLESGEGTIPVNSNDILPTWDAIMLGERMRVMSCSDKLCKYNIVGIQGALLSHFVEPIYFDSLIVGGYYHKNHLARAMYGRVAHNLTALPFGYKLNMPHLSSITHSNSRRVAKSSNKSILWSDQLSKQMEILSCKEGKKIEGRFHR